MIVVDTSAVVPFVLPDEAGHRLDEVAAALVEGTCAAPPLLALELANVIWKTRRSERMSAAQFEVAITNAHALSIDFDPGSADATLSTALDLASRHDLTAYDAAYLELALRRHCALATHDRALRTAALAEGLKVLPTP